MTPLLFVLLFPPAPCEGPMDADAELARFPPAATLQQWYDCNRQVKEMCEFNAACFPGRGWKDAAEETERLGWAIYGLLQARRYQEQSRYAALAEAREWMGEEMWRFPASLCFVPYWALPAP